MERAACAHWAGECERREVRCAPPAASDASDVRSHAMRSTRVAEGERRRRPHTVRHRRRPRAPSARHRRSTSRPIARAAVAIRRRARPPRRSALVVSHCETRRGDAARERRDGMAVAAPSSRSLWPLSHSGEALAPRAAYGHSRRAEPRRLTERARRMAPTKKCERKDPPRPERATRRSRRVVCVRRGAPGTLQ